MTNIPIVPIVPIGDVFILGKISQKVTGLNEIKNHNLKLLDILIYYTKMFNLIDETIYRIYCFQNSLVGKMG